MPNPNQLNSLTTCGAAARIMGEVRVLDRSTVLEWWSPGLAGAAEDGALEVVAWDLDAKPYLDAIGMDVIVMIHPGTSNTTERGCIRRSKHAVSAGRSVWYCLRF